MILEFDGGQLKREKDFKRAVIVSAQSIGRWCNGYSAKLMVPKKGIKEKYREGNLPKTQSERMAFVEDLVNWIDTNSQFFYLFSLFLFDDFPNHDFKKDIANFDHHDDTCCWALRIDDIKQYESLKKDLAQADLPEELFYPSEATVCVPAPNTKIKRFFSFFGMQGQVCLNPREYKEYLEKGDKFWEDREKRLKPPAKDK